jgi:hypothetical protein
VAAGAGAAVLKEYPWQNRPRLAFKLRASRLKHQHVYEAPLGMDLGPG